MSAAVDVGRPVIQIDGLHPLAESNEQAHV